MFMEEVSVSIRLLVTIALDNHGSWEELDEVGVSDRALQRESQ